MIDWERVVAGELRASSYCVRKVKTPPTAAAVGTRITPCGGNRPRSVWRCDGGGGDPFWMFCWCAGIESERGGRNLSWPLSTLL